MYERILNGDRGYKEFSGSPLRRRQHRRDVKKKNHEHLEIG